MRRQLPLLIGCLALAVGSGVLSGAALAQGTSTSAGDQQYVDPLTSTSAAPPTSSTPSAPSSSQPSTPGTAAPQASPAPVAGSAAGSASSSASNGQSSGTLPYTGLNVWAIAAVGLGLIGGGVLLRLTVRRA